MDIDAEAVKACPYGGRIAAEWMTLGLMMRPLPLPCVSTGPALASPGFEGVRRKAQYRGFGHLCRPKMLRCLDWGVFSRPATQVITLMM